MTQTLADAKAAMFRDLMGEWRELGIPAEEINRAMSPEDRIAGLTAEELDQLRALLDRRINGNRPKSEKS